MRQPREGVATALLDGGPRRWTRHLVGRRSLFFIPICLMAVGFNPGSARAVSPTVDLTVDAFAFGGGAMGVPISEDEKKLVKPLVQCLVDGGSAADCAKTAVIEQFPAEAQAALKCIAKSQPVSQCATDEVIRRLPPQSQQLAQCMAASSDLASCGRQFANGKAAEAVATLTRLKADGRDRFGDGTGGIQNILNVVQGIAEENWQKVLENGGAAVVKFVAHSLISALVTPAIASAVGPIVDTVIDNRFDLFKDLFNAIKARDFAGIARIAAEAYVTFQFEALCAVIQPPAVKEAVCGTLGKVIGAIGSAVETVTRPISDLIADALGAFGSVGEDIGKFFAGKDSNCGTPERYYEDNYLIC